MGKDRNQRAGKRASGRDFGGFVALPWSVVDSKAYRTLSHTAKSLLIEFARQYRRDNNGSLIATLKHLKPRGWNSADVISRAKNELIDNELIFLTVQGHRPNKASWYAITWQDIDLNHKYDPGTMVRWPRYRSGYLNINSQIGIVKPSNKLENRLIEPLGKLSPSSTTPSKGSIVSKSAALTTPPHGNHLEIPSTVSECQLIGFQSAANNSSYSDCFKFG